MSNNKAGVLFWLSPVLGLLEAFRDLKSKQSRQVLFGFCLCFGICFSVGLDRIEGSADGISMRQEFEESKNLTTDHYLSYLSEYFEFDGGAQDIYIVSVAYLVGKVTDNYHFFFLFLAFVFAFFQLKCLRYFVNEDNYTNSAICIVLACLFLWNNIFNINGARFWTAAWIGLFCAFKVFYDKNPIYILVSACTLMIHASFAFFPVLLLLAFISRGFDKPWLVLFVISWFFSIIAGDIEIHPDFSRIELPFLIERKVEAYTEREAIQGTGFYWVGTLFSILSKNLVELIILLIAINKKRLKDEHAKAVVGLMIVLATLSNFGMIIPTFGGRFFVVNYALVAYSFLVSFGDKKYQKLVFLLPFVWFMNLFYLTKHVMSVLDLGFLLSPFFSFVRYTFI